MEITEELMRRGLYTLVKQTYAALRAEEMPSSTYFSDCVYERIEDWLNALNAFDLGGLSYLLAHELAELLTAPKNGWNEIVNQEMSKFQCR